MLVLAVPSMVLADDTTPQVDDPLHDELKPQGQAARGLYYSGMRVRYLGAERMVRELERAKLNAAVIDLKDGEGQVTYDSAVEILAPQEKPYIEDPRALMQALREGGIYTIGRIVCFTDPSLPQRDTSRAVMDGRNGHEGEPWARWEGRNTWLDPFNGDNHDLIVALAKEAEAMGVDEIQLDYFRFPVDEAAEFAVFPADDGRPRHEVLAGLLERIDREVKIPIGVDVFGVTAFRFHKPKGLGQIVASWLPYVEVLSPMLYVNGMSAWMRGKERRAERLVRYGVNQLRERLGDGVVLRPFLQAFERGADSYSPDFIAEQVRGVILGGGDGYLFWHVNSDYDMVTRGMRGPVRRMLPLPIDRRRAAREAALAAEPTRAPEGRERMASKSPESAAN
jgi:hypothetical protein